LEKEKGPKPCKVRRKQHNVPNDEEDSARQTKRITSIDENTVLQKKKENKSSDVRSKTYSTLNESSGNDVTIPSNCG